MPRPLFHAATQYIAFLLCGCGVPSGEEIRRLRHATSKEEAVLNVFLTDMRGTNDASCLNRIVSPATAVLWPSALSFGDGKLSYAGDARFDEVASLPVRGKTSRPGSFRMPDQAHRSGLRVVDDASNVSSCRTRITLHTPIFDGDFAVVAADQQAAGVAGGDVHLRIFRLRDGRWQSHATGVTSWGRPVIQGSSARAQAASPLPDRERTRRF